MTLPLSVHQEALLGRPYGYLRPRVEAQLVEDVQDVVAGRPFGDHEVRGDLAIRETPRNQPSDLALAMAELPDRRITITPRRVRACRFLLPQLTE